MMTLQEKLYDWENLLAAWRNASRGKRGRGATARYEILLADNLLGLQARLQEQTYQPGPYANFYVHEPKKRLISAAPFYDRVAHHALCNITQPYFEQKFIADSYANRIGKGTHRALNRATQFARRYKYVLQCDVVQFFPSLDHAILSQTLSKMLPDQSVNWMIERVLASGQGVLADEYDMVYFPGDTLFAANRPRGLPIGNLTSQLWANCYLNPFDHFVKRELSCPAYLRYVDDFLLFGDDKKQLWRWREAILKRLERFRLTIHEENALVRPVTDGIPFLGFIIFPEYRRLKPRKGYAFRRKLWHLLKTGQAEKIQPSVRGWINHARYGDTFGLRRAILGEFGILARPFYA
jgi:retron-type reverse transcriptase